MKIYKDTFNKLWGYELDGSQDHLIPDNFIQITDEEAQNIRAEQIANQPVPVPLTPAEKLANAGLSIDELKELLGIS